MTAKRKLNEVFRAWSLIRRGYNILKFHLVLRELGEGRERSLLDLGCGDGTFAALAAKHGFKGFGIDISPELVERARTRTREFHFQCFDIHHSLPFPPNHYDVVVALDVLEHLVEPRATLREVYRVLRQNGRLVVSFPTFESGDLYGDPTHRVFLSLFQWRNMFTELGWRLAWEEIFPAHWLNRFNRRWTCPIFFLEKL